MALMSSAVSLYTPENCAVAYQLNWSYALFWTRPPNDHNWFSDLQALCEKDSIRLLQHQFKPPNVSQFLVSTTPSVPPVLIAQRVKGRLQHLVRAKQPRAFRRNYSLRSLGSTRYEKLDAYIASQVKHHPMADARVQERFAEYQIHRPEVDLAAPRRNGHADFCCNLHVVFATEERWREIRHEVLVRVRKMIESASQSKGHFLRRAGILPDHVHLTLGCDPKESPGEVALSYMNNLAYAQLMGDVFRYSYFVGMFGEYDLGVIPRSAP